MRARALILAVSVTLPAAAFAQDAEAPPSSAPPPTAYAPPPRAPDAPALFGDQGQFAIAADLPLMNGAPQFAIVHESQSMGGPSTTTYEIAPSADYFVAPNLSVGGLLEVAKATEDVGGTNVDLTIFAVEGRIGYNIPLSDLVSIWPRVGIAYAHGSGTVLGTSVTVSTVPLVVDVPLLIHPAPHFFLGPGFLFDTELSATASAAGTSADVPKTTHIGAELLIGGYFGGE
jgi:hypothetical protein